MNEINHFIPYKTVGFPILIFIRILIPSSFVLRGMIMSVSMKKIVFYWFLNGLFFKYIHNINKSFKNPSHVVDIDECASDPCQNGATCVDRVNYFECTCPFGFYGWYCETGKGHAMSSIYIAICLI